MLIENASDDVYTGVGQNLHGRCELCLMRVIAAGHHQRIAGIRSQDLRIGGLRHRRCIYDHQSELRGKMLQNHAEHRAREQFLRVGRNDAGGQHIQTQLGMNAARNFPAGPPRQKSGQSHGIVDVEQPVLARMPHVGIDQQRSLAELREHRRQIRGQPATALAAFSAGNREHFAGGVVEPAQNQLAAQRAQRFHRLALRLMSRDDIITDTTLAASRQDWIVVLMRKRQLDIVFRDAFHLHRGLSKSHALCIGEALNVIHILGREPALFDENRAYRTDAILRSIPALDGPVGYFIHIGLFVANGENIQMTDGSNRAEAVCVTRASLARTWMKPILPSKGTPRISTISSSSRTRRLRISIATAAPIPSTAPKNIASIRLVMSFGLDGPLGANAVLNCTTLVCCVKLSRLLCASRWDTSSRSRCADVTSLWKIAAWSC